MSNALMATYKRLPVSFERGDGVWLWDTEGKRYLDALSGIAVCGLGHAHPAIQKAICDQASKLLHTSNLYQIPLQEQLGEKLIGLANMQQVFFANSGAEANEAAIKIARFHGNQKGVQNPTIVVMERSFHGRTLATLTATGNRKVQAGFEPLVQGFIRIPYDDIESLKNVAENSPNVVAVLVEPVQGEGGINIPAEDYLTQIRQLCDENGWLMMLDEIQTGIGRSGKFFSHQHQGIVPDVMTLAKALGNGMPIGACLVSGKAANLLGPGNHGTTFGGNPLACRVALTVLETVEQADLTTRAEVLGAKLLADFADALIDVTGVEEIRGQGLLIGIELEHPCGELVLRALEQGLLINVTADKVIRLLPPLIMSDKEAEQLVQTLSTLIRDFLTEQSE
ncbi:aspartate aminotransferase family protein [Sedimenticola thiotaurini]|uniref:Acetylornithine aminotransferase n=1 Tax=Sedimenticola thiotaurini TaxID=1543721 RepID=A0A0F7JZ13_9GAMM|nr:aspartate aminotransferase family protein [Sedimenticola thiotaurini]AKH20549.1 acetylornithine aminotransferase [Sedimenticola thiotaurini]